MADLVVRILAQNMMQGGIKAAEKDVKRLGDAVHQVGNRLKLAGVAAVGFGTIALKQFADFDKGVREIGTLLGGLTDDEVKRMSNEIRAMSEEYGQAIDKMTKARYDIVSAGFTDAAESARVLADASKLAVAGVAEVSQTADVLTSVLNAYGWSAERATEVSDMLFTTVRLGKTTIPELASGLGRVIAVAPIAGVSLQEVSAAVATLTAVGQSTDEVVTALTAAINAFLNPSQAMEVRLKALGFESGKAAIDALGFADALAKVTEGADAAALTEMFGNVRAFRAVAPLAGKAAEKFAANLEQMGEAASATGDAFSQMADTAAMKIARLQAKFKSAMITIGEALVPVLDIIVSVADWFSQLGTAGKTAVLGIVGAFGALRLVSPIITAFGTSINQLLLSIGPGGWLIAGLAAVAIGIFKLHNEFKQANDELKRTREEMYLIDQRTKQMTDRWEEGSEKIKKAANLGEVLDALDSTIPAFATTTEAINETAAAIERMRDRFADLSGVSLADVADQLYAQLETLRGRKLELVAALTIKPDDAELQEELTTVLSDIAATAATFKEAQLRLYPEQAAEADRTLLELEAESMLETQRQLEEAMIQQEAMNIEQRQAMQEEARQRRLQAVQEFHAVMREIRAGELAWELEQINLQAEHYKKVVNDELAVEKWAAKEKLNIVKQHLQQRSGLWKSFSAAYDTFIQSLVNKEMTGKERRERVWEATQNAFIQFLGNMLKNFIANVVAQQIIAANAEKVAIIHAKITGTAIANAYAAAATLASIATLGAAAAAGSGAVLTALGVVKGAVAAMNMQLGGLVEDRRRGTDTVPAMLTPGEAVIPRETVVRERVTVERLLRGEPTGGGEMVVNMAPSFEIRAIDAAGVRDFLESRETRRILVDMVNDLRLRLRAGTQTVTGEY